MPRAVRFKYPAKPLVAKVVLTSVRWTAELLCCALCVTRAQDTTAAKPARHGLQGRVYGNLTVYSSALNITMTGATVIRTVPAVLSGHRPRQS